MRRSILLVAVLAMLLGAPATAAASGWTPQMLHVYQQIRKEWPKRYKKARRVAWCESHWQRYAHNPSGASGVFQIMPFWFTSVWIFDPYDVDQNIRHAKLIWLRSRSFGAWVCQPWDGPIRF